MARKFTKVRWYDPKDGAVVNGVTVHCLRCTIEHSEDQRAGTRRRHRRRAIVTAIDTTDGHRLPVAYCAQHVPDDMHAPPPGTGVVRCEVCNKPAREHSLLEACHRPL